MQNFRIADIDWWILPATHPKLNSSGNCYICGTLFSKEITKYCDQNIKYLLVQSLSARDCILYPGDSWEWDEQKLYNFSQIDQIVSTEEQYLREDSEDTILHVDPRGEFSEDLEFSWGVIMKVLSELCHHPPQASLFS